MKKIVALLLAALMLLAVLASCAEETSNKKKKKEDCDTSPLFSLPVMGLRSNLEAQSWCRQIPWHLH